MVHAWEGMKIMLPCMGRIIMVLCTGRKDARVPKDSHGPVHVKDSYNPMGAHGHVLTTRTASIHSLFVPTNLSSRQHEYLA